MLALNQPPGFEGFIAEMAAACETGEPDPRVLKPLFESYGMKFVGPPLGAL
jgi:hypothetical protein